MTVRAVTPFGPTPGQSIALTAAALRRDYLEPVLDAQAVNDVQAHATANATPETDCVVDHLNQIVARPHDSAHVLRHAAEALAHAARVYELNQAERAYERQIAGAADRDVRDVRRVELRGESPAVTAREIVPVARLAPDLLGVLARGKVAAGTFMRVVCFAPVGQMLAPAVAHEIGHAFAPWRQFVEPLKRDAHAVNVGAADSREASGHAAT